MPANPELRLKVIDCIARGLSPSQTIKATGISNGGYHKLKKNPAVMAEVERRKRELEEKNSKPKPVAKSVDRPAVSVAVEVVGESSPNHEGRPPILADLPDEVRREFLRLIRDYAASIPVAAAACELNINSVQEWLRRGEGRDGRGRPSTPLYAQFARDVRKAEAESQLMFSAPVLISARTELAKRKPTNIEDAKFVLQRRFPDQWGPTQKLDVQFEAKLTERVGEHLTSIYAAIAATDRIPEEFKVVFYEVIAGVSGDGPGELVEG